MIRPTRSLVSLRPGEIITNELFDELRYGDTIVAGWVNSFGSAVALQDQCNEYVKRRSKLKEHDLMHPAERLFHVWEQQKSQSARSNETLDDEMAWVKQVNAAHNAQRFRRRQAKKGRHKYL